MAGEDPPINGQASVGPVMAVGVLGDTLVTVKLLAPLVPQPETEFTVMAVPATKLLL